MRVKIYCKLAAAVIAACALSGCISQRRVAAGFSDDIAEYYALYPSIEFDVAAVTAGEADEIKSGGVEKYFDPNNSLRKRLQPFTAYFSEEQTAPAVLPYYSPYWDTLAKKKPTSLAIIASLPHDPGMGTPDPRMLFIDLSKHNFFAKPVYIEIEPQKVVQIYRKPEDPKTHVPAPDAPQQDKKENHQIHGNK